MLDKADQVTNTLAYLTSLPVANEIFFIETDISKVALETTALQLLLQFTQKLRLLASDKNLYYLMKCMSMYDNKNSD